MFGLSGLNRKVAFYMAAVALGGLAVPMLGWSLIYLMFAESRPETAADLKFHAIDYVALAIFAIFAIIGVVTAIMAATSLTRRIVSPVSAVAAAVRRMAEGDVTARVEIADHSMGEVVDLAHDFNMMAARLEGLSIEAIQWNAAIAHELRTPLTILKVRLQGLTDGVYDFDDEFRLSLVKQVDGLTRLVEDLRSLSLAESGRLHLSRSKVSLGGVIEDTRVLMDAPLRKAGFTAIWQMAEITVEVDAMRLRQALLALVENARIHATPGPLFVGADQDGDAAILYVADAGPGVDPALQSRMFEAFSHEASRKGSGLGLAVVGSIARAHGGEAQVAASNMGGSVFSIRLHQTPGDEPVKLEPSSLRRGP